MGADYSDIGLDNNLRSMNCLSNGTVQAGTNSSTESVNPYNITAGVYQRTMQLGLQVGGAFLKFDAVNNRIIVNDGTTNRIVIGSVT